MNNTKDDIMSVTKGNDSILERPGFKKTSLYFRRNEYIVSARVTG